MRTAFAAAVLASVLIAPAAAQTPTPGPATAPAAPTEVLQCAPSTQCITGPMVPIGTPVKFKANAMVAIASKIHKVLGQVMLEPVEDVIVNGRLIVVHGPKSLYMAFSSQPPLHDWTVVVVSPCSIGVTAGWIWTQDFQKLPLSFSDPKTSDPNLLTIPLVPAGPDLCRVSNLVLTAYVSGPPTIVDFKTGNPR